MINATHLHAPGVFTPPWNRAERENSNRRTATLSGLATILVALPMLVMPPVARAEGPSCSLSRAAATWTFTDSGAVIGIGPRAALGKFTLTAAGSLLNGAATSSLNGAIAEETFYGTYTVNSDCTGTMSGQLFSGGTELFTITLNIVFDRKMEHLHGLFTSVVTPGGVSLPTVIALDARRE